MRRAGFTLMEVIIAMALMALVMTTVMEVVDDMRQAVDTIHNLVETENTGPRIIEQIEEDLSRLAVYDAAEYEVFVGDNELVLGVEADRLDFLVYGRSRLPVSLPGRRDEDLRAPLNEVGYRLRPHPTRDDFLEMYRREDPLVDDEPFRDGAFSLLYDRVISFDVQYAARPEINMTWHDDWNSQDREALPFALDVFLELEVQPRRSLESLGILGANRARLDFHDVLVVPEETRWRFRNRLHPQRPSAAGEEDAQGGGQDQGGDAAGGGGAATGGSTGGGARESAGFGGG